MQPIEFTDAHGLMHFLSNGSPAELAPLYVLAAMSMVTWCIIALKAIQAVQLRRRAGVFVRRCWQGGDAALIGAYLARHAARDPWTRLTLVGLAARDHLANLPGDTLDLLGTPEHFLTRTLRRGIGREAVELESGLTALATVASMAPFVGLFGTVWGIYHALIAIGTGGQSSLDQVAGPVGETLIMTALGLATAMPAVAAHNIFVRSKRRIIADLDDFAHDLFVFLATSGDPVRAVAPNFCPPRQSATAVLELAST